MSNMKLLQEMYELSEALLLEDFGNLKFIEKKLLKAFYGPDSKRIYTYLGRDSTVTTITTTSASAAFEKLDGKGDADAKVGVGILFFVDNMEKKENQKFLAIRQGASTSDVYTISLVGGYLGTDQKNWLHQNTKLPSVVVEAKPGEVITAEGIKEADIRKLFVRLVQVAKEAAVTSNFAVIYADEERKQTKAGRTESRVGLVLTPRQIYALTEKNRAIYIKSFKRTLEQKLEDFKNNQAPGVKEYSFEKAFAFIVEKGFLDKVKIGPYVYEYSTDNFNFRNLRKSADSPWDRSYIEYRIKETPAYEADKHKYYLELRAKIAENEASGKYESKDGATEAAYRELGPKMIPRRFKIFFKLAGSAVVPDIIEVDKDGW